MFVVFTYTLASTLTSNNSNSRGSDPPLPPSTTVLTNAPTFQFHDPPPSSSGAGAGAGAGAAWGAVICALQQRGDQKKNKPSSSSSSGIWVVCVLCMYVDVCVK